MESEKPSEVFSKTQHPVPKNAGLMRRALAWVIDLPIVAGTGLLLIMFPGLFFPLDLMLPVMMTVMVGMQLLMFAYLFCGPAFLPNTIGRFVAGVEVVDTESGNKVSWEKAFVRMLTLGLWPVEMLMIAFSKTKRRLGDRLAKTSVRIDPARIPFWKRFLPVVTLIVCIFSVMPRVSGAVANNMAVTKAAREYLRREYGIEVRRPPHSVRIREEDGRVRFKIDEDRNKEVKLERDGDRWTALAAFDIYDNELGNSVSVVQDGMRFEASLTAPGASVSFGETQ